MHHFKVKNTMQYLNLQNNMSITKNNAYDGSKHAKRSNLTFSVYLQREKIPMVSHFGSTPS